MQMPNTGDLGKELANEKQDLARWAQRGKGRWQLCTRRKESGPEGGAAQGEALTSAWSPSSPLPHLLVSVSLLFLTLILLGSQDSLSTFTDIIQKQKIITKY